MGTAAEAMENFPEKSFSYAIDCVEWRTSDGTMAHRWECQWMSEVDWHYAASLNRSLLGCRRHAAISETSRRGQLCPHRIDLVRPIRKPRLRPDIGPHMSKSPRFMRTPRCAPDLTW